MWIGVLRAGLRVAMWITHVGGKFRHGLLEKSPNIVLFEASKLVSTKTLLLKHYYRRQGRLQVAETWEFHLPPPAHIPFKNLPTVASSFDNR